MPRSTRRAENPPRAPAFIDIDDIEPVERGQLEVRSRPQDQLQAQHKTQGQLCARESLQRSWNSGARTKVSNFRTGIDHSMPRLASSPQARKRPKNRKRDEAIHAGSRSGLALVHCEEQQSPGTCFEGSTEGASGAVKQASEAVQGVDCLNKESTPTAEALAEPVLETPQVERAGVPKAVAPPAKTRSREPATGDTPSRLKYPSQAQRILYFPLVRAPEGQAPMAQVPTGHLPVTQAPKSQASIPSAPVAPSNQLPASPAPVARPTCNSTRQNSPPEPASLFQMVAQYRPSMRAIDEILKISSYLDFCLAHDPALARNTIESSIKMYGTVDDVLALKGGAIC